MGQKLVRGGMKHLCDLIGCVYSIPMEYSHFHWKVVNTRVFLVIVQKFVRNIFILDDYLDL